MSDLENNEVKESKRSGFVTGLIGFTAGAIVGGVTALLLAPQSGKETREKIKERMGEVSEKAGDLIDRTRESIEEAKDRMAHAYEEAVEKTSSLVGSAKEKLAGKKDSEEE